MNKELVEQRCPKLETLSLHEEEVKFMKDEIAKAQRGGDCHELIAHLLLEEDLTVLADPDYLNRCSKAEPMWLRLLARGILKHRLSGSA